MNLRVFFSLIIFLSFSIGSFTASINQNNPGAILQRQERENYLDPAKLKEKPKESLKQKIKEPKIQSSSQEEYKNVSDFKLKLTKIKIEGNSLLKRKELNRFTSQYLNQELDLNQINKIPEQLTKLYQDKGFANTQVYLPPQKIGARTLLLKVQEGIIEAITLEEGEFFKSRSILPRLKVSSSDKLDLKQIEKDLARLAENPDLAIQTSFQSRDDPSKTELKLKVQERFPLHLDPFVDNLGNRLIGEERYGLTLTHNNLFGFGDREVISGHFSQSSFGIVNSYEIPVWKYGTKIGFNYAYSQLELGKELEVLRVEGSSTLYSPYLSQELFRNKDLNINADLALDFKNLQTDILEEKFTDERLRIVKPGLNFNQFDRFGRSFLRAELGWGVDLFGATGRSNRFSGRVGSGPNFLRSSFFGTRITQLPFEIQNISKINAQYSDDLLNSAEQQQIGGAFTVRGYKEGQFSGDSGFLLSTEFRAPIYPIPSSWGFYLNKYGLPSTKEKAHSKYLFRENLQLVGFLDGGITYTNQAVAPVRSKNRALGIGGGLRIGLTKLLSARIDLGIPLERADLDRKHGLQVHFGLQSRPF